MSWYLAKKLDRFGGAGKTWRSLLLSSGSYEVVVALSRRRLGVCLSICAATTGISLNKKNVAAITIVTITAKTGKKAWLQITADESCI